MVHKVTDDGDDIDDDFGLDEDIFNNAEKHFHWRTPRSDERFSGGAGSSGGHMSNEYDLQD